MNLFPARVGMLAALAILVLPLTLGSVDAKLFQPTFGYADATALNTSGVFAWEYAWNRGTGIIQSYTFSTGVGHAELRTRMGSDYVTNSGDLLGSYSATTQTSGHIKGHVSCVVHIGGATSTMALELQKWRLVGGQFNLEENKQFQSFSCDFFNGVDQDFVGTDSFSYNPGQTYRILLQTYSTSNALGTSESTVDFCSTGGFRCGTGTEQISLQSLYVINQKPVARFNSREVWVGDTLGGTDVTGRGCDVDGYVAKIEVSIDSYGSSAPTGSTACWNGSHHVTPPLNLVLVPGSYAGHAKATDNEALASVTSDGTLKVLLLPFGGLLSPVPSNFPDLDSIAESQLASTVNIKVRTAPTGSIVRAYKVWSGSQVFMDTLTGYQGCCTNDNVFEITYNRTSSTSTLLLNGVQRWGGGVTQVDGTWWHIRATPDAEIPVNDPPAPDVEFDPIDTMPDQSSPMEDGGAGAGE